MSGDHPAGSRREFRHLDAERPGEGVGVLADVPLLVRIGRDVQRDIADDETARISRRRDHRAMADQPPRKKFRIFLHDRVQENVGVEAALHQRRNLAGAGGGRGLERRIFGPVCRHDPVIGDIQARLIRNATDLSLRPEHNGQDQSSLGALDGAGQRVGAARMNDAGRHRLEAAATFEQPFESMLRHVALLPRRRRHASRTAVAMTCPAGSEQSPSSTTIP